MTLTIYQNVNLIFLLVLNLCFQYLVILTAANTENDLFEFQFNPKEFTQREDVDWAFSPIHTMYLAKEENIIYTLIQKYRNAIMKKVRLLESYTNEYTESTKLDVFDEIKNEFEISDAISAHSLMTYRMIRRFAYNLNEIQIDNVGHEEKSLLDKIQEMDNAINLPTNMNFEDIMDNILRLQNIYELRSKDLIHGIFADKSTGVDLTINQAYELGKHAFSKQMYTQGLDWFENVIYELKVNPNQDIDIEDVLNKTRDLINAHDNLHDTVGPGLRNLYNLSLNTFSTKINTNIGESKRLKSLVRKYAEKEGEGNHTFTFMNTCNGLNVKTAEEMSKLYCYFDTILYPVWKINPLKIEIHSWDPYVIQIYDVIGDKAIEYIQKASSSKMRRATVLHDVEGIQTPYQISSDRTSSYSFLEDIKHEPVLNLEKKIGYLTGLIVDNMHSNGNLYVEMEASEQIQVAIYGFGGHFAEHIDALENYENETKSGDRIGTFMLYLNNVESGGYTAFPITKVTVPPVKGSALFWYNLMKNGIPDERTLHGGCPVILGEKWIATKWIRYNANFRKRPCSLDPLE